MATRGLVRAAGRLLLHRRQTHDRLANRGDRKLHAELVAERGRPRTACEHGGAGLDGPRFGHDAAEPAALHLDAARGAVLVDGAAEFHERGRHGGRRLGRIGRAVAGREDAAFPRAAGRLAALRGLAAAQHVRGHANRRRELAPLGPAGNLGFVVAEVQQAAALEARVFAAVCGKLIPQLEAPGGHGQFARVAVLLAAPAPVAARLFGADAALFDHGDRQPALGQVVGGEDTDDPAADHDDVGTGWQVGRGLDETQWLGHGWGSVVASGWHALAHVELRHAIAALPADRCALRHEQRIAGDGGQHAAIGAANRTPPASRYMNSLRRWARTMRW